MIRITIVEAAGHVLYTHNSDYELERVTRVCSFLTSPFALKEIQERKERTIHAGNISRVIKPCPPDTWMDYETYESLNRMLRGHSLPLEGQFAFSELVKKDGAKIPLQYVHDAYCLFCEKRLQEPLAIKALGKALRDHYGVVTKQTTFKGRNVTCLIGYEIS